MSEKLVVEVDARGAQQGADIWARSMDRIRADARKGADAFGLITGALGATSRVLGVLGASFSSLIGYFALSKLAEGTRSAVNYADALQTVADVLGVNAQRYAELREAAARTDVKEQEFEMSMKRLAGQLGEVARGKGELVEAANRYGIALVDGRGKALPFEESLKNIADRVMTAKDNTEALDIVTAAFGVRSVGMVNLLKQGSAGWEEMAKQSREAGLVLSNDYIARGSAFEEQLRRASTIAGNELKKAFIDAAPLLIRLVQLAGDLAKHLIAGAKALGLLQKTPIDKMGENESVIKSLQDRLAGPDAVNSITRQPMPGYKSGPNFITERVGDIQRQLDAALERRNQLFRDIIRDDQGVTGVYRTPGSTLGARVPASAEGAKELEKIGRQLIDLQQRQNFLQIEDTRERERQLFIHEALQRSQLVDITKLDPAKLELRRQITEEAGKLYDTERRTKILEQIRGIDPALTYAERVRQIREYAAEGLNAVTVTKLLGEAYDDFLSKQDDALSGALRGLRNYGKEATNIAKNVEEGIAKAFGAAEDALVQFVTKGKVDFKSLVDSIIADLARLVIRQTITGPIANALSSALGGLFGSGTGAGLNSQGSLSPTLNARGNVFASTPAPNLIPFARGDIITKPIVFPMARGMGIAGEAGYEEAIVPLTRTRNGMLGVRSEGMGGRRHGLNVVINNYGNDEVAARESDGPDGPQIEIMIGQAVARDITGHGRVAKALEQRYNLGRKTALRG